MGTLVIRPFPGGPSSAALLCIRNHDLGGVDYDRIAKLTFDQAKSILAGTRSAKGRLPISCNFMEYDKYKDTPAGRLEITPRPDPKLEGRNWILNLMQGESDPVVIGYVSTGMIHELHRIGADVDIKVDEPDVKKMEIALTQLRIAELRQKADDMEAALKAEVGHAYLDPGAGKGEWMTLDAYSPKGVEEICQTDPAKIDRALKDSFGDRLSFKSSHEPTYGLGNFSVMVDGRSVLSGKVDNYCTTSDITIDLGDNVTGERKAKLDAFFKVICEEVAPDDQWMDKEANLATSVLDSLDF